MPTVGERLARLEQIALDVEETLREIRGDLVGGHSVRKEDSIHGRLHKIENTLRGAELHAMVRGKTLKRWQAAVILLAAVATAAAPYVAIFVH